MEISMGLFSFTIACPVPVSFPVPPNPHSPSPALPSVSVWKHILPLNLP